MGEAGNGGDRGVAGPRVRWKYEVILFDNGQLTVVGFPKDQALATFMHVWGWEVIKDFFKAKAGEKKMIEEAKALPFPLQ